MVKLDVTRLPGIVQELGPDMAAVFSRIYSWYVEPGRLVFPDTMKEWVREKYGDIETQQIVRVTNNLTGESALQLHQGTPPGADAPRRGGTGRADAGREGAVCKPP